MTSPGFFLVLEGPEGAGKSTLGAALAGRMRERGIDPVIVREPGGTPAAERIRELLLDPGARMNAHSELLFMTAARSSLVHEVIRPALKDGRVVMSDRFDLSTFAYQVAGRGLERPMVEQVNACATMGTAPDVTLVLDVDPAAGRARQTASGKAPDRIEQEDVGFHQRVWAAYRQAAGTGVIHLDAGLPAERVAELAWAVLQRARPETFGASRGQQV